MRHESERRPRRRRDESFLDHEPGGGHRHARLQHLIGEELDTLLRDDLHDPLLRDLRLLSVELSVDYRHACVAVAALPGQPLVAIEAALERAAGFLRARLAQALDLKYVPQLRFRCLVVSAQEGGAP